MPNATHSLIAAQPATASPPAGKSATAAAAATPPDSSAAADAAATTSADALATPFACIAVLDAQLRDRLASLWRATVASAGGRLPEIAPDNGGDKRFEAEAWHSIAYFSWLRQAYLVYADYLRGAVRCLPLPAQEAHRAAFFAQQFLDAIAPSNFAATNPLVQKRAIDTGGTSLVHGAANFAADLARGRMSMTDSDAFEVGRNIATTPGSVVFRNELIEVLQYDATTPSVHKRPLVVIPPCINKYYILDLSARNSFVRHAVAQGHTTFIVSWRNIPAELGRVTWDDYLQQGVLQAIDVAQRISGSKLVNALGFCVGGTLLASALAVLAARKEQRVASLTLLATMLDFADPGEIGVYVTPQLLAMSEQALLAGMRMPGSQLASAFSSLRANDLVWNYVVDNYLNGRTPRAFDMLYWNGDSCNLPGPMYAYYLREMYLANRLREPGGLTMLGQPVDLSRISCPAYILGTHDDHIVPWKSAFRSTALLGGDAVFVLGASGHIAGVVNPPEPPRRHYWRNRLLTDDADDWLARADRVDGSWWPHWSAWLAAHAGGARRAPLHPGSDALPPLGPAPGRYVREPS